MNFKIVLRVVCMAALLFLLTADKRHTTIFIIGDSTAAEKAHPDRNPERGWGMVLQGYFDDEVTVDNHAVNGRSSKSFMDEGRWDKVLARLKPGDYVIIQFGHNDEKPHPDRHTEPGSTFDAHLAKYVEDTRARGGIPVLMNCVVRRNFLNRVDSTDDESLRNTTFADEQVNSDTLVDTHGAYKDVPRRLARQLGVAFVDANRITHDLEQGMGIEGSRRLHMWFRPGEVESIPQGRHDNTHYNVYGARMVASLLADALGREIRPLRKHVVHYDYVVSRQGRGNYMTLEEAVAAIPQGAKAKVRVLDGTWTIARSRMQGKRVQFVCRPGASVFSK